MIIYNRPWWMALALVLAAMPACHKSNKIMLPELAFERNSNATASYDEVVAFYRALHEMYPRETRLTEAGPTDSGYPLLCLTVSEEGYFTPETARAAGKLVLFINNGIHPGEPEGIDATMLLLRDYLKSPEKRLLLRQLVLVVVPVYNIDGCLNRGAHSRANQNGPEAYGFRGNARNLDLNRDFVKCDSRNARSFNALFASWKPEVLVDNHTSNGADYSYTMTLIPTQADKLSAPLGRHLREQMLPALYAGMEAAGWPMCPYVNTEGETPDSGIYGFLDVPRFSTGYAALHHCIGFMPETHMLKPFADRLWSTYAFMEVVIKYCSTQAQTLRGARAEAETEVLTAKKLPIRWQLDPSKQGKFRFKGYEARYKPSEVSGLPRLWYDRNAPFERDLTFYDHYLASKTVEVPDYYLIPQAYDEVIARLALNGIKMERLEEDTEVEVKHYLVEQVANGRGLFEGHYLHTEVKVKEETRRWTYRKGDYRIATAQPGRRYLVETLEPEGSDSFFAWNFFDGILSQKEYFSAYVFEDLAAELLRSNPDLRKDLEEAKKADSELANSGEKQLEWVYERSPYYEPTHNRYPVGRLWIK